VKIAVVAQRYGADINGGAELHARYIAEHLARHAQVEVLTSCARDYITWRNDLPAGADSVNGLTVTRFPVSRERDVTDFGWRSRHVFEERHSVAAELAWLDSEGPTSPALVRHIVRHARDFDFFIFFSYRYYHAFHGVRAVADRAVLVPTAERDPALGVNIFGSVFRGVRALMYNSFEERAIINAVSGNGSVPGVIVGVGSEVPARTDPGRFRQKYNVSGPFAIYVGRIDKNKGCEELFDFFGRYASTMSRDLSLLMIGTSILPIPDHPRIRHIGFLEDREKFDAMAAADLLVMPSYYESLSMVTLEAWALGRPVLVNGRCDVLKGQCIRGNAGLYYENYEEFAEALYALERGRLLRETLGRNGHSYFQRHYAWPVIERRYVEVLEQLQREPATGRIEPLPNWFGRRRATLPPARDVVAAIPAGPVLPAREPRRGQTAAVPAAAVRRRG
jgi:glycosyltransferase involved in cell wall biosynthesis